MWGRTDAELYFSPHHSFYSSKQTRWQGSAATGTWEGQPEQQRLCPHEKVTWWKRRSRSVVQNHLLPALVTVLEGRCRVVHELLGQSPCVHWQCLQDRFTLLGLSETAHLKWSTRLYPLERKFRILAPRTGCDPNWCMNMRALHLPSNCVTALNQNTPLHTSGVRTTET